MNFSLVNNSRANQFFRKISMKDVLSLKKSTQEYSDCYLISSLNALTNSQNGRNLLRRNIRFAQHKEYLQWLKDGIDVTTFKVIFNSVNKNKESFIISPKDINSHYNVFFKQKNKIVFAIKMAMKKLINKYPDKKPWYCRVFKPFNQKFEYNKPSNFLKMFTGVEPINIAENDINLNLKKYKSQVLKLLEKMGKDKDNNYSFVIGTGFMAPKNIAFWHCLSINKVDIENKLVYLQNKRANATMIFTFDEIIKKFKFIVGYFNENLKKQP